MPAAEGSREARPIVALLQRLDRQIADDRLVEPQDDNVAQTLQTLIGLLERASIEDLQLVRDLPSHLARRADQAASSGRDAEAKRFLSLAAIVSRSPPGDAAERALTQIPHILAPDKDPVVRAEPAPAQDAASPPQYPSAEGVQSSALKADELSAMSEPAAGVAAPRDMPDTSGMHFSKSTPSPLLQPLQLPTVFVTPPALREVIAIPPPVVVPPTPRAPGRATAVSSRCRSIAQKFAIGEAPSEAERDYLREGCQGG